MLTHLSTQDQDAPSQDYRLEAQVGFLLRLASQRHAVIFQKHSPDQLTPTQFTTLIRLSEMGQVSQNHLGRLAAMDVATVKGVVDRLKAKGLVHSKADALDKRRSVISLSDKGAALIADLRAKGITSFGAAAPESLATSRTIV